MLTVKQAQENIPQSEEASSLVKQLVDIEILYILTFSPKSGYELKKQLQNWFKINVSYGTLYPHLHTLEKNGFIAGKWQEKFESAPLKKRAYSLTQAGEEILRESIESLTKIALTMQFMMTHVDIATPRSTSENKIALSLVERFFLERDYLVKKSLFVSGFSGVEYPVELIASIPGSKSSNMILRVIDRNPLTIDDVLKTHVMSFDLEARRSIILSPFAVSEETSKLAEFYHISVFGGRDLESAANSMCSSYRL